MIALIGGGGYLYWLKFEKNICVDQSMIKIIKRKIYM